MINHQAKTGRMIFDGFDLWNDIVGGGIKINGTIAHQMGSGAETASASVNRSHKGHQHIWNTRDDMHTTF
jgi:hypothetical protein